MIALLDYRTIWFVPALLDKMSRLSVKHCMYSSCCGENYSSKYQSVLDWTTFTMLYTVE